MARGQSRGDPLGICARAFSDLTGDNNKSECWQHHPMGYGPRLRSAIVHGLVWFLVLEVFVVKLGSSALIL